MTTENKPGEVFPLKPSTKMPTWLSTDAVDRFAMCMGFLHLHGITTDTENSRIQKRLKKWIKENRDAN